MGHRRRAIEAARRAQVTPIEQQLEKDEQREVYRLYTSLGCEVVWFSQPRKTMQTEGIPDLLVFCRRKSLAWWHETKRPKGGKQSDRQKWFQDIAQACKQHYILGGWEEAVRAVIMYGLVPADWRPVRQPA